MTRVEWSRKYVSQMTEDVPRLKEWARLVLSRAGADNPRIDAVKPKEGDNREQALSSFYRDNHILTKSVAEQLWPLVAVGRKPTWDLLCGFSHGADLRGVLMVEAKAHHAELDETGKPESDSPANDGVIVRTLADAGRGIRRSVSTGQRSIRLSTRSHYQLANRLAVAWRMAERGQLAVLLFLGFVAPPEAHFRDSAFRDDADWQRAMGHYLHGVFPAELVGRQIRPKGASGSGAFIFMVSSLPANNILPAAEKQ